MTTDTDTRATRLAELCERLETNARQALEEGQTLRPDGGYSRVAYSDLVEVLQRLERCADHLRYAQQRDRGLL